MNQEFIDQMKERLLAERSDILESIAEHNEDYKSILEDNTSKDVVDEATDVIDLKRLEALEAREVELLELINSALSRIESGQYGICMRCNSDIPAGRLEAIPYADLCVDCKSALER